MPPIEKDLDFEGASGKIEPRKGDEQMFPQLQSVSSYSLLQSTLKIPEYLDAASQRGYTSAGLMDLNNMSGAVEFYRAAGARGIKPLFGLQVDYEDDQHAPRRLLFLAMTTKGFHALIKISTRKMTQSKPLQLPDFAPLAEDVAVITPGNRLDPVLAPLFLGEQEMSSRNYEELKQHFSGNLFLGMQAATLSAQQHVNLLTWLKFGAEHQQEFCALQEVRFLDEEDAASLAMLRAIDKGENATLEELPKTGSRYLRSAAVCQELFLTAELPETETRQLAKALENAERLASAATVEMNFSRTKLPHFPVPEGTNAAGFLQRLAQKGLKERISADPRYEKRLAYELSVIHQMGFDDYFLIVWDLLRFAREQGITLGAGRGSAAGSLVAYALFITGVDPIKYDLLFERFLNPERQSMPDIDIDIPDNRRQQMIRYVIQRYGEDHVAQIATFGTLAAKMVLRDVGRVLRFSQSEMNLWSKAIPRELHISLVKAYEESRRLQALVSESERNRRFFTIAQKLEGLPRHLSTHAAGVVISDQPLDETVPLERSGETLLTQFTMGDVEAVGLLKMDFLGLRNLTIIADTLAAIRKDTGQTLKLEAIPLDDPKTLQLFQKGETIGIFQFEKSTVRNVLRRLHPESIEDIAAVNALNRPGPSTNIPTFIRRKHGEEPITYPAPALEPVLKNTYGIIVYQEQIMQIASVMAGFSLGQADILRRAISKKKKRILDEQRLNFIEGAEKKGYSKKTAEEVYRYIERFADYGFNRSHAFAYSFVGFQLGYLKAHFPEQFFAALMDSVSNDREKIRLYINDARRFGIRVTPPDINLSRHGFVQQKGKIIFGFDAIKGMRRDFIDAVLEARRSGPFRSFEDFMHRLEKKKRKKEMITLLIQAGAFDTLTPNRNQLVQDIDPILEDLDFNLDFSEELGGLRLPEVDDYPLDERLQMEESLLGVYVSSHPIERFDVLKQAGRLPEIAELSASRQPVSVLGYVKGIRVFRTKKGESMAALEINDLSGELRVTLFPRQWRKFSAIVSEGAVYLFSGKVEVDRYNQGLQLLAENIQPADDLLAELPQNVVAVKISSREEYAVVKKQLDQSLSTHPGHEGVEIYLLAEKKKIPFSKLPRVGELPGLTSEIAGLIGENNVKVISFQRLIDPHKSK
jgi:DNA polymerase-3 subunit alpha